MKALLALVVTVVTLNFATSARASIELPSNKVPRVMAFYEAITGTWSRVGLPEGDEAFMGYDVKEDGTIESWIHSCLGGFCGTGSSISKVEVSGDNVVIESDSSDEPSVVQAVSDRMLMTVSRWVGGTTYFEVLTLINKNRLKREYEVTVDGKTERAVEVYERAGTK